MDDDTSSIASFEEVGPHGPSYKDNFSFKLDEEERIKKLRELVTKRGGQQQQLADGETPDVCYVLQFKGLGGKACRSSEPIDVKLGDFDEKLGADATHSILEIVTKVTTSWTNKKPRRRNRRTYSDEWGYERYDTGRKDNDADMKISNVEQTTMTIKSSHLINALQAIVGYYPGVSFSGTDSIKIGAPYQVLVHHRAELASFRDNQPSTHDADYIGTTAKHIDVLLKFLDKTLGESINAETERQKKSTPKATFENLWMLYKPGEIIYTKHQGRWCPFVISKAVTDAPSQEDDEPGSYSIECWNFVLSGNEFERCMYSFGVDPFSGEEAIKNLPVIPARFYQENDGTETPLETTTKNIKLGKSVWELAKEPAYKQYSGKLMADPREDGDVNSNTAFSTAGYMDGRVVIDCDGYNQFSLDCPGRNSSPPPRRRAQPPRNPPSRDQLPYFAASCGCRPCTDMNSDGALSPFAKLEDLSPSRDEPPTSEIFYLVLNKVVPGFSLSDRRWGHFAVENLEEVSYDKDAFKWLVLDDDIKLTVKALIGKFASNQGRVSPWPSDFVKNKGQGRIFLLHGGPGCGKTATAESLAELMHRPLLSLTSGDLSTNSYTVERNLEYFLQLGERYGAMVLLDEADVYLEARRATDIERNGLVSIFLRALEYYRGVLFLTTNRVQTFDSAFTSRVHVALHYRPLTDDYREKIWMNSFERLERDSGGKVRISVPTREYAYDSRDVQSLRWNGREIRNALQTAVALAETEAFDAGEEQVVVTDRHLRNVVKMSRGFKNFLQQRRLRGEDEDEHEEEVEDEEE